MRMRTILEAHAYLVAADPDTALTKTAFRRLVVSGAIPSVKVGNKYLVALESVENYLKGATPPEPVQPMRGFIRPVEAAK